MRIKVLTYNVSWATQSNKVAGSEKDFVEACQTEHRRGGKQCHANAIRNVNKLKGLDLVGFQEVNSDIEPRVRKSHPALDQFHRDGIGQSVVSIMWNSDIFGTVETAHVFNLAPDSKSSRPCLMILTTGNFVLINVHAPQGKKNIGRLISDAVAHGIPAKIRESLRTDARIIVMGDFNDGRTLITSKRPVRIKTGRRTVLLRHNKSRKQLRRGLKTCCWHKRGHADGHFKETGDYVLVDNSATMVDMYVPSKFNQKSRKKTLFSDHKPVVAEIELESK